MYYLLYISEIYTRIHCKTRHTNSLLLAIFQLLVLLPVFNIIILLLLLESFTVRYFLGIKNDCKHIPHDEFHSPQRDTGLRFVYAHENLFWSIAYLYSLGVGCIIFSGTCSCICFLSLELTNIQ